jgi:hypothetical protein
MKKYGEYMGKISSTPYGEYVFHYVTFYKNSKLITGTA